MRSSEQRPDLAGRGNLSFLIVGAGAIGGITAALMKKAGHDVEVAVRTGDYASLISDKGIEVTGVRGRFNVRIPAYSDNNAIKGKKDIVILATKATDLIRSALDHETVLKKDGYFVSLQNGIIEEDLAAALGKDRLIGCVTGWGATMAHHGKMIMTSVGVFVLGYPEKEPDNFLLSVADALSSVVPVSLTGNIMGHKYSKLIINACITSLGAICGLHLGKMLSKKKIRNIFLEIMREAVAVSEKMQIRIEVFSGRLDFYKFMGDGLFADLRRHLMIMAIGFKYRKLKSSSLQSLERGQLTEIDYLNGYIVKHGKDLGVDVQVNSVIVNMIHEIESGKRVISVNNFDDPVFDRFD